jgi:hypothetical protein
LELAKESFASIEKSAVFFYIELAIGLLSLEEDLQNAANLVYPRASIKKGIAATT